MRFLFLVVLGVAGTLPWGALAASASDGETEIVSDSPWTMFMGGSTHCGAILASIADAEPVQEWAVQVGYDHTYYNSQPVAGVGSVYVAVGGYVDVPEFGADEYAVLALAVETGEILWKRTMSAEVTDLASSIDRYSVFAACKDGFLYALDMGTGAVDWKARVRPSVWSAPIVVDDCLYVGSTDDALYCLRLTDGSTVWRTPLGEWPATSPVVTGSAVYATTTGGEALRLRREDGAIVWRRALSGSSIASPSFSDGILFCGTAEGISAERGRLAALDGLTGERLWETAVVGEVRATPAVRDGVVYFSANEIHAVSTADGSDVCTSPIGTRRQSPVVADDSVLVVSPTRGEIVALDRLSGHLLFSFCPTFFVGDATQVPLFFDYSVVIACADGYVRCFRLASPSITITNFSYTCVPLPRVQTEASAAPPDGTGSRALPRIVLQAILLLAHVLIFGVAIHWLGRLR